MVSMSTINVGGKDNYAALERDLQKLDSYTLRVIAAHIAAEQNRRTRTWIQEQE